MQSEEYCLIPDDRAEFERLWIEAGFLQTWSIGIYAGSSPFDLAPQGSGAPVLTRDDVTDEPAVFVADPFMVRGQDRWYMFFEVMNWRTGKGEIGLATSHNGWHWNYQRIVLAEPFHLSYPYVFEWRGDYYMVPESYQAKSVRLYRATEFPTYWSFAGTLLEAPYIVDASPFRHDDKWWMFAETSPQEQHDTLRLYHADELLGPWREHPRSPIVQGDAQIARPAGRVLACDGRIVRFAQNCLPDYGVDVRAFEVTELTTSTYQERPLREAPLLGPSGKGWNASGMHHVDAHRLANGEWLACVDGWSKVENA
jgi:hypothetical protein